VGGVAGQKRFIGGDLNRRLGILGTSARRWKGLGFAVSLPGRTLGPTLGCTLEVERLKWKRHRKPDEKKV